MTAHVLSSTTVGGVELRRIVYDERMRLPRHLHATAGFCLVLDGTYDERYRSRTLACAPHTVTFSPAGEEHANDFAGGRTDCFTIELPDHWLSRFDSASAYLCEPFRVQGGPLEWLASRLLEETRAGDEESPIVIEGLVVEMIGESARAARRPAEARVSRALRQARELVAAHFAEPLSLADVAAAVGRNPVYLATEFRRSFGETVGDCVRRLRVEQATRLLAATETPLADVALACGFAHQSHFTRAFKRVTGMTPALYRRQMRS